ncbi:uncharacterized protein [Phyllobates terribilis]|uniref:uncharacterized protein n=1 Tax=Phyllobates terribilis TaxID=111132 RepID=UPI003CCB039D
MEFVRNMERRRLIKPQDILATLQSIPEDESESELQEHVFDSDSDEDFIPQNISSESEDSEGTNPEDIPSTSTGDRAHAVMLPRDHPPGRGQKKSAKRPRNERTTDNDGGEGNATTNTREGESEGILVSADGIQWKPVEIGEHLLAKLYLPVSALGKYHTIIGCLLPFITFQTSSQEADSRFRATRISVQVPELTYPQENIRIQMHTEIYNQFRKTILCKHKLVTPMPKGHTRCIFSCKHLIYGPNVM